MGGVDFKVFVQAPVRETTIPPLGQVQRGAAFGPMEARYSRGRCSSCVSCTSRMPNCPRLRLTARQGDSRMKHRRIIRADVQAGWYLGQWPRVPPCPALSLARRLFQTHSKAKIRSSRWGPFPIARWRGPRPSVPLSLPPRGRQWALITRHYGPREILSGHRMLAG